MKMNRWRYVGVLLAAVVVISAVTYVLWGFDSLVSVLMIEASTVELLGVIIAALPGIPYLRGYTSAVRTVNQIDNAVNRLADRGTEIDESVSGFHHVASELVDQTDVGYPTTIRSTPIATKYWIDDQYTESFNVSSLVRETRRLEQRSREWFQSLGLTVIGIGFAVQLLASILATLL